MSKINLEAPFQSFRGKICKHSKIIFAQRGQTQYTSQICNPRTKAYSEEELARQAKFCEHRFGRRYAACHVRDCVQSAEQVQELARLRDCEGV